MSAVSRLALQVIAVTLIEWTFRPAGLSVYCSWPNGALLLSVKAVPPKLTLLPSLAIIQPPCAMSIVQSGLLTGSTHAFVAVPHGGPPVSPAQPVITSVAGRTGPEQEQRPVP